MPRTKAARNIDRARQLRREMTLPEVLLWNRLRKAPDGVIFRRQHPVGKHIVDFYCAKARTCIEIDGIAHDMGDRPLRDQEREIAIKGLGYDLIRVPAADVLKSTDDIADALVRYCKRN